MNLTDFYRSMQAWIVAGRPIVNPLGFYKGVGLCGNLSIFCPNTDIFTRLAHEMAQQFERAGLDTRVPFNSLENPYWVEFDKYENPKRLAWIKEHAK